MIKVKDGFPEQRMVVISKELLTRQKKLPVSRHLYITDIGHFPRSENHFISRKNVLDQYIMIFCASGRGWISLNNRKQELTAGQLVLIPPGVSHEYKAGQTLPWNIYWFHFAGDQACEYAEMLGLDQQSPVMQIADVDELVRQFEKLYAAVVSAFSDTALTTASVELARTLCLVGTLRTERHRKGRESEQRILKSIIHITHHYQQAHSLKKLARQSSLSVPHYVSLFRKQTGTSPMRYLIRVRLRHACELLDHTAMNISEIAQQVGYEDTFYFSRVFNKNTGLSPTAYRKHNLNRPPGLS